MIKADVHVCLVSEQLLPNLLPVLDTETRPQEVVLLVTPKMETAAERLKILLGETGCRVSITAIRAYRIEDIRESVLEVIAAFPGVTLALNATGGTKVMALGAYGVFRDFDLPVFYIDSENEAVVSLSSPQQTSRLSDLLKIETCLKCYGYKVISTGNPELHPKNRRLYQSLVDDIERWEQPLGNLNYFAGKARHQLWCKLDESLDNNQRLTDLMALFQTAGHLNIDGDRLIFRNEDSRSLVQGGWLEQYVYGLIEDLRRKQKVRDTAIGVVVKNMRGTKNEIDVACTYANRLHVIECKTANLRGEHAKGDDIVYKLDNLRDLMGGTYSRALLVSYRSLRREDRARCHDNDVSVVFGNGLKNLKSLLSLWFDGKLL